MQLDSFVPNSAHRNVLILSIDFEMSKRPNKRASQNQQREENEIKLVKSLPDEQDVNIH